MRQQLGDLVPNVRLLCPAHDRPRVVAEFYIDGWTFRPTASTHRVMMPAGPMGNRDEFRWRISCPHCARKGRPRDRIIRGDTLPKATLQALNAGRAPVTEYRRASTKQSAMSAARAGAITTREANRLRTERIACRHLDLVLGEDI